MHNKCSALFSPGVQLVQKRWCRKKDHKPKPGVGKCLHAETGRGTNVSWFLEFWLKVSLFRTTGEEERSKEEGKKSPAVQTERDPGSRTWRFRGTFHPHRRRKTDRLIAAVVEPPRNCRFCLAHLTAGLVGPGELADPEEPGMSTFEGAAAPSNTKSPKL